MDNLDFNYFCTSCKHSEEYRRKNCFANYRTKIFERGDIIALKGKRVKELALLVSGSITVSFVLQSGIVIRSTQHKAPYPIGALALLGKENRYRVDIAANERCDMILVSREEIEKQIMSCREFMVEFYDYSTSKVDLLVEHIALLSHRSISAKLAHYILSCSDDGKSYKFKKSIKDLSELLSVGRPSLSRVIAKFVCDGTISHNRGKGEILNLAQLNELIN